jgi:small conductance mechanosensitive channel
MDARAKLERIQPQVIDLTARRCVLWRVFLRSALASAAQPLYNAVSSKFLSRGKLVSSRNPFSAFTCIITLALSLSFTQATVAAEAGNAAKTARNVQISEADLNSLLLPMTKAQLEVEAAAWQGVLEKKVRQIGNLEIQNRKDDQGAGLIGQVGEQLKESVDAVLPTDGQSAAAGTADTSKAADSKHPDQSAAPVVSELDEKIAVMRVEQGGVNKRFGIVLDALEAKGGDVADYRLYLSAVSGINLSVDDTAGAMLALREWIKSDDGGLLLLVNLVKFAVAIAFVLFLSRLLGRLADRVIAKRPVSMLLENFIKVGVRRSVLFIGLIACLPLIGVNIGPVLALIGAAGLVIGLALQGTLSNFASGVLILIYRPYDTGDAITVAGLSGKVSGMNLLYTTINTFDNQLITIPNNSVWNDAITNITGSDTRRVDMVFGIGYGDDFAAAQGILRSILESHPKVLKTPEPVIRVHELADSSVNLVCRPWSNTADYWDVYWDVTETAKREFDKQGISIPFPQRDVHFFPAAPEVSEKQA